jgi:hypothetical protein
VSIGPAFVAIETTSGGGAYRLETTLAQADLTIASVQPQSGGPGTTVAIGGTGFTIDPARTVVLFGGVKGLENENDIWRRQILSPTFLGSKISEGPERIYALNKEYFLQRTQVSAVLESLRRLEDVFDALIPIGFFATLALIAVSGMTRNLPLLIFAALPFVFLIPYALTLSSVDRYAFPVYPSVLSSNILCGAMAGRRISSALRARMNSQRVRQATAGAVRNL